LERHKRGEDLPGEALHHGQGQSSELVLGEDVEQAHVEQLKDDADVPLVFEGLEHAHDVALVLWVKVVVELAQNLDFNHALVVI